MKTAITILISLVISLSGWCQQYYLRGEVKDESGNPLQNVTIIHLRSGYVYKSGTTGAFGIVTNQQVDSFSFSLEGYKSQMITANADNYLSIRMKVQPASAAGSRQSKLSSLTNGMFRDERREWFTGDETYASIVENRFVNASRFPNTGLSLNVDRASYSNIRRFLTLNTVVPPDAVRIEEMLNYFNLNYTPPANKAPFEIRTKLTGCPWNPDNQLFYINLSAKKIDLDTLPPSNLVFLIDVSGSMDMTNRLPLLKSAFRMLINNLRAKDSVAIVVYGGVTGIMLNTTSGAEKDTILHAIDELTPGGSTPGESGIKLAYSVARNHYISKGNNRVILATDGDFNVGMKTEQELDDLISLQRQSGIYLTCLGVGMGNYKDSKIQTLARKGNGNFAYIDNFMEAEKVLLQEFSQTLYAVADNAYMNVEFNPQYVKQYRLLGFDNKVGAMNDSLAVVEGGEIGSGYSMMGIFEIEPRTSDTVASGRFAQVRLQYRNANDSTNHEFSYNSFYNYQAFEQVERCYRFSAAVALFGSLLRNSSYTKNSNWTDMVTLATETALPTDMRQQEFVSLTQLAKILYSKGKKKKRSGDDKY